MKRLVSIITIGVVFGYIIIAIYSSMPTFFKKSHPGKAFLKAKTILAQGPLFTRSLRNNTGTYRFYQNGKWEREQRLLEPLFNEYTATGNFAALTHCRLDIRLFSKLNRIGRSEGIDKLRQNKAYSEFVDHLIFRHNNNVKPDSIEIAYYKTDFKRDSHKLLLTFKCKP